MTHNSKSAEYQKIILQSWSLVSLKNKRHKFTCTHNCEKNDKNSIRSYYNRRTIKWAEIGAASKKAQDTIFQIMIEYSPISGSTANKAEYSHLMKLNMYSNYTQNVLVEVSSLPKKK